MPLCRGPGLHPSIHPGWEKTLSFQADVPIPRAPGGHCLLTTLPPFSVFQGGRDGRLSLEPAVSPAFVCCVGLGLLESCPGQRSVGWGRGTLQLERLLGSGPCEGCALGGRPQGRRAFQIVGHLCSARPGSGGGAAASKPFGCLGASVGRGRRSCSCRSAKETSPGSVAALLPGHHLCPLSPGASFLGSLVPPSGCQGFCEGAASSALPHGGRGRLAGGTMATTQTPA